MMPSQTLKLPEATIQLPLWFNQTTPSRPPLWIEPMEGARPPAVAIDAAEYKHLKKQTSLFYESQITNLEQWLDQIEQQWDNDVFRVESIQFLKKNIVQLWEAAPQNVREFIAALTFSVKKLNAQTLSKGQLSALRYALTVVRSGEVDEDGMEKAHYLLVDNHIAPTLTFDREVVQLYLDEL